MAKTETIYEDISATVLKKCLNARIVLSFQASPLPLVLLVVCFTFILNVCISWLDIDKRKRIEANESFKLMIVHFFDSVRSLSLSLSQFKLK